jgi:hypothetical protein
MKEQRQRRVSHQNRERSRMSLFRIVAAVLAAAAALPAAGFAAKPVISDHGSFVDGPEPGDWCGAVLGTWSGSGTFSFREDASGDFHATQVVRSVFTATATGKSIELQGAGLDMGTGIDNGDGTVTFTERNAGLALTVRILGGPILKDADGKPLIGAGVVDSVATFEIASGDLVSFEETWHGPHPLRDGVDICTPATAYLTS